MTRNLMQYDFVFTTVIERRAEIQRDAVFQFGGRFLKVYRVFGDITDRAAPVIVEELTAFGTTLPGQYALWSQDAVLRCLGKGLR